jgi:transcriptional/translational regulatory protein YebC/TACO1
LIYGAFASFGTIQKNLKTAILKSFRPVLKEFLKSLKLTEAEMADVEKLIEKMEEDDVMNVYHTMEEA